MTSAHLTLRVGEESYAVPAAIVRELVVLQPMTRVPTMPPCVRGLMNLRGTVLPVVDLARQLGLGETAITGQTCMMVVDIDASDGARSAIGVIADEMLDVVVLDDGNVEAAPAFGSRVNPRYLSGITRLDGRYAFVLDLTCILSPEEIFALGEGA